MKRLLVLAVLLVACSPSPPKRFATYMCRDASGGAQILELYGDHTARLADLESSVSAGRWDSTAGYEIALPHRAGSPGQLGSGSAYFINHRNAQHLTTGGRDSLIFDVAPIRCGAIH